MGIFDKVKGFLLNLTEKVDEITEQQNQKLKEDMEKREADRAARATAGIEAEPEVYETLVEEAIVEQACEYPTELFGFPTVPEQIRDEVIKEWFQYFAVQGDAEYQRELAYSYYHGKGMAENMEKALEWFEKAGENGDVESCYNCGIMYSTGEGTILNYDKAIEWLEKSAERGNTTAMRELATLYSSQKSDNERAAKWLQKAANLGDEESMEMLGIFYAWGMGIPQNDRLAVEWWINAAERGRIGSYTVLGIVRQILCVYFLHIICTHNS